MAAVVAPRLLDLDAAALARLASLGVLQGTSTLGNDDASRATIPLDWPELERILPDHGLPRGVIELASPAASAASATSATSATSVTRQGALRGGATTIALSALRAAHAASERAWCAWITDKASPSLYAPAVAQAGVDLDRLLVVRPEAQALARTVVKVAASGAFDLVVVDAASGLDGRVGPGAGKGSRSRVDGSVIVRKLALASEETGTSFLLLTNMFASRPVPWPVALRLEVERRPDAISVRVTKDRRGRASSQHVVRVAS